MLGAVILGLFCVGVALCIAGLYLLDTVQKARLEYEEKQGRLRLAAVAERYREFEKDHPGRERIGLTEEER